jgi:hypothetical protein
MQSRSIVVRIKSVYGRDTIYPVCESAKLFAAIAGTVTLTPETIQYIKGLQFGVLQEFTPDLHVVI